MPKRSNPFQHLMKTIYDAMAKVSGGSVSESAALYEPDGTPREVDILIESVVLSHNLKIAVECHDRTRKDDVEWIDGLIGKYKNLGVQKIIAVSNSGFTDTAKGKAAANNIEIMTLEQCLDTNWPDEFQKLNVSIFKIDFKPQFVRILYHPMKDIQVERTWVLTNSKGLTLGTFDTLFMSYYKESVVSKAKEHIDTQILPSCKVIGDLEKSLDITVPFDVENTYFHDAEGNKYELKKIVFILKGITTVYHGSTDHYKYGNTARISIGTVEADDMTRSFNIIQVAGSKDISVRFEKK